MHDSFYTQPQIIQVYQDWVSLVVNRYKDSPSIFAWELANEARCSGEMPASPNCTVETLSTWMRDQSAVRGDARECQSFRAASLLPSG